MQTKGHIIYPVNNRQCFMLCIKTIFMLDLAPWIKSTGYLCL